MPTGQPIFFPVTPLKLVAMSIVTFGIYEIYWFYKNWKLIKQRTDRNIIPFWRAFFAVIFCYPCFEEIQQVAKSRGVSFPSSPGFFAVVWIALTLTWRLPDPYGLVYWLTPLVLVPIQKVINDLNAGVAPNHNPNARFSGWNITGTIIGGILFVLSIVGTVIPQ
ncbi:MAG: hypothetical protein ABSA97_08660 [Verrucomicrobiia bacterium]